jgi:biotin transporter BioY
MNGTKTIGCGAAGYHTVHTWARKKDLRSANEKLRLPWWFILCGMGIIVFYSAGLAYLAHLRGERLILVAENGFLLGLFYFLLFIMVVAAIAVAKTVWARHRVGTSPQAPPH